MEIYGHATAPIHSAVNDDNMLAWAEIRFHDGTIQRFERLNDGQADPQELRRLAQGEAIQAWNSHEAEQLRQKRLQEQGDALLQAFSDESVFNRLVAKVAQALSTKPE